MTSRSELDRKFIAAVERLGRALRVARQKIATKHKISLLQLQLIELLGARGQRRVGELALELDVTQPTVSDALAALERKGALDRHRDSTDGRATVVSLSLGGEALAAEVASEVDPMLDVARDTDDGEQAVALKALLEEIRRLQMDGVISVNRSCLTCRHYRAPTASTVGRCEFLDEIINSRDLRVDCADHLAA